MSDDNSAATPVVPLTSENDWRRGAEVLLTLRPKLDIELFVKWRDELQGEGYRLVGAIRGDEVLSVASFTISPHPVMRRELLIHDMATKLSAQKKGYAREILVYLEGVARQEGCGRIFVHTRNAADFYRRSGYSAYSTGLIQLIK